MTNAPRFLAAGKSTHYPILAAEIPITSNFTRSADIRRPWTRRQSSFNAPSYTQSSISGTVNMLAFDVLLSYSESDAAETPSAEALLKVKRQF